MSRAGSRLIKISGRFLAGDIKPRLLILKLDVRCGGKTTGCETHSRNADTYQQPDASQIQFPVPLSLICVSGSTPSWKPANLSGNVIRHRQNCAKVRLSLLQIANRHTSKTHFTILITSVVFDSASNPLFGASLIRGCFHSFPGFPLLIVRLWSFVSDRSFLIIPACHRSWYLDQFLILDRDGLLKYFRNVCAGSLPIEIAPIRGLQGAVNVVSDY